MSNEVASTNEDSSFVHELSTVVTVPRKGWYGFCLQVVPVLPPHQEHHEHLDVVRHPSAHPEQPRLRDDDDNRWTEVSPTSVERDPSSSLPSSTSLPHELLLCIQPPCARSPEEERKASSADEPAGRRSAAATTTTTTYSYSLPFVHDGIPLDQSLRIGRAVFLGRGTGVQVVEKKKEQQRSNNNNSSTASDGVPDPVAVLVGQRAESSSGSVDTRADERRVGAMVRWRLVPHQLSNNKDRKEEARQPNAAKSGEANDAIQKSTSSCTLDLLSRSKRRMLVCAEYRKGFVTLLDVTNHLRSRHPYAEGDHPVAPIETGMHMMKSELTAIDASMWAVPLVVLYNDDVMSVVVKPQGMPVMGSSPSLMRSDLLMPLLRMPTVSSATAAATTTLPTHIARKRPASPAPPVPSSSPSNGNIDGNVDHSGGDGSSDKAGEYNDRRCALFRKPRPVHRLDARTGGLLVVAKTLQVEAALRKSFATGQVHKTYVAIVIGKLQSSASPTKVEEDGMEYGVVDASLSGKACRTLFRTLLVVPSTTFGFLTKVELLPRTGRRHQLRRHMQHLGHSILGDVRYMTNKSVPYESLPSHLVASDRGPYSRMCLWATRIRLPHPALARHDEVLDCSLPEPIQWLEFVLKYETGEGHRDNCFTMMLNA